MPQKTKNGDIEDQLVPSWVWMLLLVLAITAYFAGLDMPLVGPDEPRYAQVAREMFQRGDLITPTLGGYHWFEKPALLYWLQNGSYGLFGVTEFAARLGPALFGMGSVLSLWMLGRSVNRGFGQWLALIAASSLGILVFAHGASFDIIITFPMTASLVSFYVFDQARSDGFKESTLPLLAFYIFIGISLLAKGLIGIVFPFAIVGFYHLISWKMPGRRLIVSFFWGTLLAIAVAATWYLPMYTRHGYEFINEFFLQHHFQRFTSNKFQHPQPFYFFFWVLPLMTVPWLPFFGVAAVGEVRSLFSRRVSETRVEHSAILRFAWAWLLVPLVFFSLSGSKLPGYILPAVPAATVITTVYLYPRVKKSGLWRGIVIGLAGLTFTAVIAAALIFAPRYAEQESVRTLIAAANSRGYTSEPVLMFLRISHSAEFYAAGRLVRDNDGKQQRILTSDELIDQIRAVGRRVVVLVPRDYASHLTDLSGVDTEFLGENEEFKVAVVTLK